MSNLRKLLIPSVVLPILSACGVASAPGPHSNGLPFASPASEATFDDAVIQIGEKVTTTLKSSRSGGVPPYSQTAIPLTVRRLAEHDYELVIGNNTWAYHSEPGAPNVLISDVNSNYTYTLVPFLEQVGIIAYDQPSYQGSAVYGYLTDPDQIPTSGNALYVGYAAAHVLTEDGAGAHTYTYEDWTVAIHADFDDSSLTGQFNANGTEIALTGGAIDGQSVSAGLSGPGSISGEMSGHFYGLDAAGMGGEFDLTYTGGMATGAWVAAVD